MKNYIFFPFFLFFVSISISAQNTINYLSGGVPEKTGNVYFSKIIKAPKLTKEAIFRLVSNWANTKYKPENGFARKILLNDTIHSAVIAYGDENLVFQDTFLAYDRARIQYLFIAKCVEGSCEIDISKIKYLYYTAASSQPEYYEAEDLISDKSALHNGKLINKTKKFRIFTINLVTTINNQIEEILKHAQI